MRSWPLLILLFPALELYALILAGGKIGAPATLGLVVLSVMIGVSLLSGKALRAPLMEGRNAANPVAEALFRMLAGWLFIFPGFVSDAIALLLLFPLTRAPLAALFRRFRRVMPVTNISGRGFSTGGFHAQVFHTTVSPRDGVHPRPGNVPPHTVPQDVPQDAGQTPDKNQVIIDCDVRDASADGSAGGNTRER